MSPYWFKSVPPSFMSRSNSLRRRGNTSSSPPLARSMTSLTPSGVAIVAGRGFGSSSAALTSDTAFSPLSFVEMTSARIESGTGDVFHELEVFVQGLLDRFTGLMLGLLIEAFGLTFTPILGVEEESEQDAFAA